MIADAPGLLTPELDIVIEPADAMIILAYEGEANRIHRWERKAAENDLDVLAEFVSVMDPGRRPFWDRTAGKGVVRGVQLEEFRIRRLDAYDATTRRIIRRLGRHLIDMAAHSAERSDSSR